VAGGGEFAARRVETTLLGPKRWPSLRLASFQFACLLTSRNLLKKGSPVSLVGSENISLLSPAKY